MPIPDFQTIMRPLLELASDGKEHSLSDAREELARVFKLTEDEKKALLPSGRQATFTNRVAWQEFILVKLERLKHRREVIFASLAVAVNFYEMCPNA